MAASRMFAAAQVLLSLGAAISYLLDGNYRMWAYWTAAAVLTTTVTIGDQ